MIRIEIIDTKVREINGTSQAGKPYSIRKQTAYLHNGSHYPKEFDITLGKDGYGVPRQPFAPGFYTIVDSSVTVNAEFRSLEFDRFNLELQREPAEAGKAPLKAAG